MEKITEFVMLNWALVLAAVILLGLIARSYIMPARVTSLRPMEAVKLMNKSDALIVDVRANDEYQKGHIVNSTHIPLANLESRLVDIVSYKTSPIIVVCRSGNRSYQAGLTLKKKGFEQVFNLRGGMVDWQQGNLPITTEVSKLKPAKKLANTVVESESETIDNVEKLESSAGSDVAGTEKIAESLEEKSQSELVKETNTEKKTAEEESKVVVYTTRQCPFCSRAVNLLSKKGVGYQELRIDINPSLRTEMEQRANRTTVPQIFIDDHHVGGCDDMYKLESQGDLNVMLGLAEPRLEVEMA